MHIVRFHDPDGKVQYGERVNADTARLIEGDLYGDYRVTDRSSVITKLLAPVEPRSILCIGLNYRKHAEESGAQIPRFPVLFMKAVSALQNPGDPILIPRVERDPAILVAPRNDEVFRSAPYPAPGERLRSGSDRRFMIWTYSRTPNPALSP